MAGRAAPRRWPVGHGCGPDLGADRLTMGARCDVDLSSRPSSAARVSQQAGQQRRPAAATASRSGLSASPPRRYAASLRGRARRGIRRRASRRHQGCRAAADPGRSAAELRPDRTADRGPAAGRQPARASARAGGRPWPETAPAGAGRGRDLHRLAGGRRCRALVCRADAGVHRVLPGLWRVREPDPGGPDGCRPRTAAAADGGVEPGRLGRRGGRPAAARRGARRRRRLAAGLPAARRRGRRRAGRGGDRRACPAGTR